MVGIDEVGRGAWAGPVVAAAVKLYRPVKGLADSKLLGKSRREQLAALIYQNADVGLGWVSAKQVDEIGLTRAVRRAMMEALNALKETGSEVIIDGSFNFLHDNPFARAIVKADMTIPAVSAASIVAKVARDTFMADIAKKYPDYQFDKHVGYGTKLHQEMLRLYGACELHRLSYKPIADLL